MAETVPQIGQIRGYDEVNWESMGSEADVNNPDIYAPYEITAENGMIFVKYRSGLENGYHQVTFDSKGRMISLREMSDGQ